MCSSDLYILTGLQHAGYFPGRRNLLTQRMMMDHFPKNGGLYQLMTTKLSERVEQAS